MMTRQEIFNKAYIGIRDQGFVRSVVGLHSCKYRGENGAKCAFGHLIPEEEYDEILEGHPAYYLLSNKMVETTEIRIRQWAQLVNTEDLKKQLEVFIKFKEWGDATFSPEDYHFIWELQKTHDLGITPETMKEFLKNFAKENDLTIPE